jgi:hypothetical protein
MKHEEIVTQINVKSGHLIQKGQDTKTKWPTTFRLKCNLKLNMGHCTANYRPVLSSERAPYMKHKEIVTQINVKSGHLIQK